jgi:hypothetical protein
MSRHDPAMLDRITGIAEKWRRRCNGQPSEGMPVGRIELRRVLSTSAAVAAGPNGVITWRANGRSFTAEPVGDDAGD